MEQILLDYGFEVPSSKHFSKKILPNVSMDVYANGGRWAASLWFDEKTEVSLSWDFKPEDFKNPIIQQLLINP